VCSCGGSGRDIVCGAKNFAVGDLVVVALPGATLPGDFEIATRKTYGRTSDGMICSAAELGMGTDHSGILVLPPGTAEPGDDAIAVLGLVDVVFDLAITPDRGYGLSVRGVAREIACAYDLDFVDPAFDPNVVPTLPAEGIALPVTIQPGTGVSRFALRSVTGIDPAAVSPWWLRRRLLLSGIRPISPAVDVTNYVMLELGHPMHAHDRDRIHGGVLAPPSTGTAASTAELAAAVAAMFQEADTNVIDDDEITITVPAGCRHYSVALNLESTDSALGLDVTLAMDDGAAAPVADGTVIRVRFTAIGGPLGEDVEFYSEVNGTDILTHDIDSLTDALLATFVMDGGDWRLESSLYPA
jgi:tRNA-binding EMAP/Myf-like protein